MKNNFKLIMPDQAEVMSTINDTQLVVPNHLTTMKSKIHGLGLFSNKAIEPLEQIWEEPIQTGKGLPYSNDGPLRWANHSDQPNAVLQFHTAIKTQLTHLTLVAIQQIMAGEEITYSYNIFGHSDEKKACHCGSEGCSGAFCLRTDWGENV